MATSTTELEAALDQLRRFDLAGLRSINDRDLCLVVGAAESLARLLSAIQLAGAAEIADRSRRELGDEGLAQAHGCVRPTAFLERLIHVSGAEAGRRVQLGSALRGTVAISGEVLEPRFPALAAAVDRGEVGPEAAIVIVRALDDARRVAAPDDLDVAEAGLVEYASNKSVQYVTDLAIVVRDRLDPDGVLPREEETRARRGIQLGRERNGIIPVRGGLAPVTAALLRSAFDEANAPGAQPRFLSDDDRRDGTVTTVAADGTETVSVRDLRSRDQRQHDVLVGLLKAGIRNTGLESGQIRSTAEVTAHISLADLEAGTGLGWIDGIQEPVSVNTIERLACDSVFRRVVLGNDGEVLAFGKARYPFSAAQRKAIIARDGDTCVLCDAPVSWADTHHIKEFYTHGAVGETNVDNGVMLCGPHHDLIHHSQWQLSMIGGVPHVLAPPEIDPAQSWQRVGRSRVQFPRTG
jgi:Domain of unknown function (DUF222)